MRSKEDVEELADVIKQALNTVANLTDWELRFCQDLAARFEVYNENTFLSDKQEAAIRKIQQKYNI